MAVKQNLSLFRDFFFYVFIRFAHFRRATKRQKLNKHLEVVFAERLLVA
jgi:hypothetical protein